MTFEARIFIQGVANYVPSSDGRKLEVLFPDQEKAGLKDKKVGDKKLCDHHAVVEMDARQLEKPSKRPWESIAIEGRHITVETDSKISMRLRGDCVPGVPFLPKLLRAIGIEQPPGMPRPDQVDRALLAGSVLLEHGEISPDSRFEGEFVFPDRRNPSDKRTPWSELEELRGTFSNVIKVELGEVSYLNLVLAPRAGDNKTTRLEHRLRPIGDEVDVWIRHFCDVGREPRYEELRPSAERADDVDFLLNYALLEGLNLGDVEDRVPIPRIPESWSRGGTIGGNCVECMGSCKPGS